MLDPAWMLTRPLLWVVLAVLIALLVVRAVVKDRREFQQFKQYSSTVRRQAMFRKWLLESFAMFGGASIVILLAAGAFVAPLLSDVMGWPGIRDLRTLLGADPTITIGILVGVVIAVVALTWWGAIAARKEQDLMTIGDISALLPRNRQELRLGALLSVNAGVVEELMFRLALPALIYGASGSSVAAIAGSVLLFGALHVYQGVVGIVGTTVVGALLMTFYAVTGTIVAPIIAHALVDLRSLVIIPVAVFGVHKVDGVAHPFVDSPRVAEVSAPADPAVDVTSPE